MYFKEGFLLLLCMFLFPQQGQGQTKSETDKLSLLMTSFFEYKWSTFDKRTYKWMAGKQHYYLFAGSRTHDPDFTVWKPSSLEPDYFPLSDTYDGRLYKNVDTTAVLVKDDRDGKVSPPVATMCNSNGIMTGNAKIWGDVFSVTERVAICKLVAPWGYSCPGYVLKTNSFRLNDYRCVRNEFIINIPFKTAVRTYLMYVGSTTWKKGYFPNSNPTNFWKFVSYNGTFTAGAGMIIDDNDSFIMLNNSKVVINSDVPTTDKQVINLAETYEVEKIHILSYKIGHNNDFKEDISLWKIRGCCSLGDTVQIGENEIKPFAVRVNAFNHSETDRNAALSKPTGYFGLWDGIKTEGSLASKVQAYRPKCKTGYLPIGIFFAPRTVISPVEHFKNRARCLRSDLAVPANWTRFSTEEFTAQGKKTLTAIWKVETDEISPLTFGARELIYDSSKLINSDMKGMRPYALGRSAVRHVTRLPTKVVIRDIRIDKSSAQKVMAKGEKLWKTEMLFENCKSQVGTEFKRFLEQYVEKTTTFSFDRTLEMELSAEVEVSIPEAAKISSKLRTKGTWKWGETIQTKEADKVILQIEMRVQPYSAIEIWAVGNRRSENVKWNGIAEYHYLTGDVTSQPISGSIQNIEVTSVHASAESISCNSKRIQEKIIDSMKSGSLLVTPGLLTFMIMVFLLCFFII